MFDPILSQWAFAAIHPSSEPIIPDGCRDLIVIDRAGSKSLVRVTDLDDVTRRVAVVPGTSFKALRLRPGVKVNPKVCAFEIEAAIRSGDREAVRSLTTSCPRTREALAAIALAASCEAAARSLGVTPRTLQRQVSAETGRTPAWWRRLARIRRASRSIALSAEVTLSLCDIAAMHGFTDQAHLTREVRAWLGTTPSRLRNQSRLALALSETGYGEQEIPALQSGARTGEHSSTR